MKEQQEPLVDEDSIQGTEVELDGDDEDDFIRPKFRIGPISRTGRFKLKFDQNMTYQQNIENLSSSKIFVLTAYVQERIK